MRKVFLFIFLFQSIAFSWGSLGHQTAAQVAWSLLDSPTQKAIVEILGQDDFVAASTWADETRGLPEWKFTIWYHFEKAPDNYTYLDNLKRQDDRTRKLGGLIESLFVAESMLKSDQASATEKKNALKFIIHLVADIHQPLHTGRVEDNSGNKIPKMWLGKEFTLHSVWDSQIIYLGRKDLLDPTNLSLSSKKYSDFLFQEFKNYQPDPQALIRYDAWMHESMVPRKDAYDFKDENEEQYTQRFIKVVDERVFLAGVRLAYTLNRILVKSQTPQPLMQLKQAIISIVGDFYQFVSLRPRPQTTLPEAPSLKSFN